MENLQPGVILNLLSDMGVQEKTVIDHCDDGYRSPVLLQIISIIPVLSEGDLWPRKGFFIKVSDSTHELFVSLPQQQDEMVLNNKLQIGQFVYVQELEPAYPVPLLKGLRPIPGRQPFAKDPKDLVGMDIMETPLLVQQRTEKARSISPYKAPSRDRRASMGGLNCRTRTHGLKNQGFDVCYSRKKQGLHSSNSHVSPVQSARFFSYHDDKSNARLGIKDVSQTSKPGKNTSKSRNSSSLRRTCKEPLNEARKRDSSNSEIWKETEMLWDTLPSSLVKLGKEVLRQRDVTLLAAVEALQEAAATEKLLKCLRKFSELRLAKEDQQPSINKFFKLQDYMTQCSIIVQSLTNISPQRMADCDIISPGSTREALKLAVNRSRNATTWIKAAVASDLIPPSADGTKEGKNEAKNTKQPSQITMLKGGCTITEQRNNDEKENIQNWVKGCTSNIARNLADTLQDECKTWFLAYIENYLDGFDNECLSKVPHSQVAESMCQIKRLNDWLDKMESNGRSTPGSSEFEAYGRLRNKIYEVLLKHVERTAVVLEKVNGTC